MVRPLVPIFLFLILCFCKAQDVEEVTHSSVGIKNSTNVNRIVGGKIVSINEVPYQVAVFRNYRFVCGGSVISAIWVLTAAHCVFDGEDSTFMIRAGSDYFKRGGQERAVIKVVVNGGYNYRTKDRDLAMLKLGKRLEFSASVQPIKLASPLLPVPSTYFVTGWGLQDEQDMGPTVRLRGVKVNAVKRSRCRQQYSSDNQPITDHMICAAASGKDACQGDSGGPLVSDNIQYGVVSFGIGCASPIHSGVYVNMRALSAWVYKVALKQKRRIRN